jgi:class 3 adenylate cyclase/tetratricopeptide (TPR) repeat protein
MDERRHLEAAIDALEAQRGVLGDATVDTAVGTLRTRLSRIGDPRREQRKLVTVLFGDVSGFTAMAESIDPEEVTAAVNALWRRVDAAIAEYGGIVDKHIGDAVMALFGAPTAHEDDAERAVRAALSIQAALQQVATEIGWRQTDLRMRFGLHTGPVHLATVGTTGEYTAMGDTVNLASRLQTAAPEGGVLISHETWQQVSQAFDVEPQTPIRVKGKSKPIRTYEVRAELPTGWRQATYGVAGIETPFVGRDTELATLRRALTGMIEAREGRHVTIVGEAGLGQSRLLDAFCEVVNTGDVPVTLLRARATRDVGRAPFGLLRDLLASRFRILDSDSDAVAAAKLESGIAETVETNAEECAHLLGHLIGLDYADSPHITGAIPEPRLLRDRAFAAVLRVLESFAVRNPVALVLEELHLSDESSLDLVTQVCAGTRAFPLLVVMSARPSLLEARPDWFEAASMERLDLTPLSQPDAEKLVRGLLADVAPLPDALVAHLVETAEGHPYYLEELVRILLEKCAVDEETGSRSLPENILDALEIPPTLTALLQARLDALPADARAILQRASVIGPTFWDGALLAVRLEGDTAGSEADLTCALDALMHREMIRLHPESAFTGYREYAFCNSLLHEVAYDTVLLRDRRPLHGRAAEWLIEQAGESAPLWAGRIAEHWDRAAEPRRSAAWSLKAGDHARKTSAFGEAAGFFERALELLQDEGSAALRLTAHEGLAEVRGCQGRYAEARAAADAMRSEAETLDDAAGQARAWWWLCRFHQTASELDRALEAVERAVDLARQAGAAKTLVAATREHGFCLLRLGRLEEATEVLERALDAAGQEGLKTEQAVALRLMGAIQARQGRFGPAEQYVERALDLLREVGDTVRVTASLLTLGELARVRGDALAASKRYEEALELARRLGNSGHELVGMSNLGGALVEIGKVEQGASLLAAVIDRAPEGWYGLPETWRFLAEARLAAGDAADALDPGRKALILSVESGNAELIGPAWRVLGEIAVRMGGPVTLEDGPREAQACFEESRRVLAEAGLHPEEARTMRAWARYELAGGDAGRGRRLLEEARALFASLGMDLEVARTAAPPTAA